MDGLDQFSFGWLNRLPAHPSQHKICREGASIERDAEKLRKRLDELEARRRDLHEHVTATWERDEIAKAVSC